MKVSCDWNVTTAIYKYISQALSNVLNCATFVFLLFRLAVYSQRKDTWKWMRNSLWALSVCLKVPLLLLVTKGRHFASTQPPSFITVLAVVSQVKHIQQILHEEPAINIVCVYGLSACDYNNA